MVARIHIMVLNAYPIVFPGAVLHISLPDRTMVNIFPRSVPPLVPGGGNGLF